MSNTNYTSGDNSNPLELVIQPFYLELRRNIKPKSLILQRKTKAGLWETLMTVNDIVDFDTAAYSLRLAMIYRKVKLNKVEEHRILTYSGRQVFSSYYQKFTDELWQRLHLKIPFGLSINKGENYLICHSDYNLLDDIKDNISEYFSKLSFDHMGIRNFRFATLDPADHYLVWGWFTFYDGFKISVAFDDHFNLFKEYKLNYTNPFLLKKKENI